MEEFWSNTWNMIAIVGFVAGVVLWTLPLLGSFGERLARRDELVFAQIGFYFAAILFGIAYLVWA